MLPITGATITGANGDFTRHVHQHQPPATTTFQNGIDLASGCIAVNGVCISGSGSAAGPDGSIQFSESGNFTSTTSLSWDNTNGYLKIASNDGSTEGCFADIGGQLEYSNDCNTFQGFTAAAAGGWTDTGTVVHLTTGSENVGIGTSTPYAKLTVWGPDTSANTDSCSRSRQQRVEHRLRYQRRGTGDTFELCCAEWDNNERNFDFCCMPQTSGSAPTAHSTSLLGSGIE